MQDPVIGFAAEVFFLVEKMERLIAKQCDMRMLSEKIV